jgi:hypothetical protein
MPAAPLRACFTGQSVGAFLSSRRESGEGAYRVMATPSPRSDPLRPRPHSRRDVDVFSPLLGLQGLR